MSRFRRGHRYKGSSKRRVYPNPMIKFFCDNCGKEMLQPSVGGNTPDGAFLYNGYNFPEKNAMVHIAYKPMNAVGLPVHYCPHCLIRFVLERIGPMPGTKGTQGARIISNE